MTVQELIDKLNTMPAELRSAEVVVQTENDYGGAESITAKCGENQFWWAPAQVIISARY
jgi:hypothetical protein